MAGPAAARAGPRPACPLGLPRLPASACGLRRGKPPGRRAAVARSKFLTSAPFRPLPAAFARPAGTGMASGLWPDARWLPPPPLGPFPAPQPLPGPPWAGREGAEKEKERKRERAIGPGRTKARGLGRYPPPGFALRAAPCQAGGQAGQRPSTGVQDEAPPPLPRWGGHAGGAGLRRLTRGEENSRLRPPCA